MEIHARKRFGAHVCESVCVCAPWTVFHQFVVCVCVFFILSTWFQAWIRNRTVCWIVAIKHKLHEIMPLNIRSLCRFLRMMNEKRASRLRRQIHKSKVISMECELKSFGKWNRYDAYTKHVEMRHINCSVVCVYSSVNAELVSARIEIFSTDKNQCKWKKKTGELLKGFI